MSVLRKYLFRQMRCNPLTVLLEILSLVIVTVVLYLNLNLAGDVRRSLEEETRKATGGYDICAEAADGKAFSLSGLDDLPKEALLPYTSRIYTLGDIPGVNYFVKISVDPTEVITRGMASLTDGRLPADETETLILITKSGNPSLAMGNVVTVYDDGGTPHSLTVCGVLSGFPLESNARPDLVELIVIPDASQTAQRVYIDSRLAGITQEELQTSHPELSVKPLLKEDDVREEIKGLSRVLLLVTGLVILLSGFILATLSGNRMEARRGDYSTFRSVGANRRQWTFLLYMENGVYALCGSVFGVPLGEICREMTVSRYYMATETKPPFLLRNALLAFAFTLCFEIAFTAVCSVRYASQSIRHSLFDKDTCAFRLKNPTCTRDWRSSSAA